MLAKTRSNDVGKSKLQLLEHELVTEEFGGDVLRFAGDLPGCAPPARSPRGAAAWLEGRAGAGRVALLSPHLEATAGHESLLGLALRRAAGR